METADESTQLVPRILRPTVSVVLQGVQQLGLKLNFWDDFQSLHLVWEVVVTYKKLLSSNTRATPSAFS